MTLVEAPWAIVLHAPDRTLPRLLDRLSRDTFRLLNQGGSGSNESIGGGGGSGGSGVNVLTLCRLLVSLLTPLAYTVYPVSPTQDACFNHGLFDITAATTAVGEIWKNQCETCTEGEKTVGNVREKWPGFELLTSTSPLSTISNSITTTTNNDNNNNNNITISSKTQAACSVVHSHMNVLLEVFVLHPAWSRSAALQYQVIFLTSRIII